MKGERLIGLQSNVYVWLAEATIQVVVDDMASVAWEEKRTLTE